MQQFNEEYRFPVEDSFGSIGTQAFHYPGLTSTATGHTAFDRLTPDSRRSTPIGIKVEYDENNIPRYPVELTPPHGASANYILGSSKMEPENMSFTDTLPSTPMKRFDSFSSVYDMVDMNLAQQNNMASMTPNNSFGIYNVSPQAIEDSAPTALMMTPQSSILMTPTRSMSGSDLAESPSPWSGEVQDSPNHFFGQSQLVDTMDPMHMNPNASFMMAPDSLPGTASSEALQRQMMVLQAQQRSEDLHRAQHHRERALMRVHQRRAQKQRTNDNSQRPPVEYVGPAKHKCEYPGCSKAFRRMEHLKRHKQTTHGEGPNRFRCEFCNKDQFNRQDNLNNHRKLHARPNSRNRGVEFMPEAVPIIEEEERSRKKRQPPKSKGASGWLTPDECF